MDDVVLNKVASIERCVRRVHEEHAGDDTVILREIIAHRLDDVLVFARWALARSGI